ncbi:glycosyltransferase family 2 protein [Pradoshia sp. D12]|uniref:glycosyltransferase family 2 protein n=1 Tax=Bacillaceae TaxID=186817 RepID=UPI00112A9DB6|nr:MULTISPECIES: glycosyltransferase family 2 protein [Bacillaceae]QFK70752.1 glycosyltransferase family 2 protein [Pradoshia sp. D12]TPF72545.1 glycosyltransferase family 2 protein [Bacillus sp. D12]
MNLPVLTIVVPCYNEQEVLSKTSEELSSILKELLDSGVISERSAILFVDDGSVDDTWDLIQMESVQNRLVKGLKLAGNVGHQNALLAGLATAQKHSDCVISIDADLQDDIQVIKEMVEKYNQGYDIVYGVRDQRKKDTIFKRTTALSFYRMMGRLGIKLIPNHADFRLMSKRALGELLKYKERNLFLRGMIPMIGFSSAEVFYDRKEREAGESKYPLKKMISFALDGITSFSVAPIRCVTYIGFLTLFISVVAGSYALIQKTLGNTQSGWTSIMISLWIIGGLQLIGIGIVGEYIGKIFKEVKQRPIYAIDVDNYTEDQKDQANQKNQYKSR